MESEHNRYMREMDEAWEDHLEFLAEQSYDEQAVDASHTRAAGAPWHGESGTLWICAECQEWHSAQHFTS